MIPPSGRVLEQGPDWFLVAIEACGSGTPDLGYFLEVWGYIRGVGIGNKSGGSTRQGARPGGRRAPALLDRWRPPDVDSSSSIFNIFQKYVPWSFRSFRELLFLHIITPWKVC